MHDLGHTYDSQPASVEKNKKHYPSFSIRGKNAKNIKVEVGKELEVKCKVKVTRVSADEYDDGGSIGLDVLAIDLPKITSEKGPNMGYDYKSNADKPHPAISINDLTS